MIIVFTQHNFLNIQTSKVNKIVNTFFERVSFEKDLRIFCVTELSLHGSYVYCRGGM